MTNKLLILFRVRYHDFSWQVTQLANADDGIFPTLTPGVLSYEWQVPRDKYNQT